MSNFGWTTLSLCCFTLSFVSGIVLGFFISAPSRIEHIRKIQREAEEQIDTTIAHYAELVKDLSDKLDQGG